MNLRSLIDCCAGLNRIISICLGESGSFLLPGRALTLKRIVCRDPRENKVVARLVN